MSDPRVPVRIVPGVPAPRNGAVVHTGDLPALVKAMGLELVDIDVGENEPHTDALGLVPRELADRLCFVPLSIVDGILIVAMGRPGDPASRDIVPDIRFAVGAKVRDVKTVVAPEASVKQAILTHYGYLTAEKDLIELEGALIETGVDRNELSDDTDELVKASRAQEVVQFVDKLLLSNAVKRGASDIHFNPEEHDCVVIFELIDISSWFLTLPES